MTGPRTAPRTGRGPAALAHRGFRRLSVAWVFTNLADSALYLMIAVWVKELTGSDGAAAAVFAALGLPALVAPLLGQLVDRFSRRRLLAFTNVVMVPIILSLLLVGGPRDVWLVYVVTFLYGATGYVTGAAQSGLVRDLLDDEELPGGNALLSTVDQAFRLISPLLGTGLYVAAGPQAVVAVTAAGFAVSAVLLARLEVTETPAEQATESYVAELTAGFRHVARTAPLGPLTIAMAITIGATGLSNVVVFPVMEQGLRVDPEMLGALVSIQGVGALIGGTTAALLIKRLGERRTITLGMLALAVGMSALVFAGTLVEHLGQALGLVVVGAGLIVVGLNLPWQIVAFVTLRQRLTPPRMQGRVAVATGVVLNLPQTLATMAGAAIIGAIDYRWLIVTTVVLVLVGAATSAAADRRRTGAGRTPTAGSAGEAGTPAARTLGQAPPVART
ncbi:MFS transporter [Georgenia sp. Z1491]|uniref:MFS transporter n=1 Tax=Georgenia sp. Z1491 TaxID=3416707 RepID=UPI003CE74E8B